MDPTASIPELPPDMVEVPLAAFHAALDLLRDLADVEMEGDGCPLCEALAGCSHDADCVVGRAQLVREALDYGEPEAQALAVAALVRA
jgi:hypothetical protein